MQKPSGKGSSLGSRKTKKASEAKAVDEVRAAGMPWLVQKHTGPAAGRSLDSIQSVMRSLWRC